MNEISSILLAKIDEQIERLLHLIALIPEDKLDWRPAENSFALSELLGHLLECLAGFCAVLQKTHSDHPAHFERLRQLKVNHQCGGEEARARIREYRDSIREGFSILTDSDLTRRIPTLFVAEGETVLTLLLGNLEHLVNHKHQLFFYLKLLGAPVSTSDLYRIRGSQQ
ncbi:MAG: DinB family protein [Acidobacteriota bacterium]